MLRERVVVHRTLVVWSVLLAIHCHWRVFDSWVPVLGRLTAEGYAHLPEPPPPGTAFDGFGDAVFVRRSLGANWYWVTYRDAECQAAQPGRRRSVGPASLSRASRG
jgi:hypothetical protein